MPVQCLTRRSLGWLLLAPFALGSMQEPFRITDNVDLVLLNASVKNSQGGYVTNLSKDDFHVFVDGHPQPITQFAKVDAPVTVGLIVDNSGSMRMKRREVIMAGLAFAKASNPKDQFFVVNFNNEVLPGLPRNTPFTDSITDLHNAMYMGQPQGQTALYDAIAYGLKHLEAGDRDQRTLIVVSDGGDNVSELKEAAILNLIQESRATIYTIGLLDPEDRDLRPGVLKKFASVSGGEYFQPEKLDDVMQVMAHISTDIRSRYSIGFSPASGADGKRTFGIKVTATGSGHKLQVRARASYTLDPKLLIQKHRSEIGAKAMADTNYYHLKPGIHSFNASQRVEAPSASPISRFRILLLLVGLACLGYYGYTIANQQIYQVYENWAFDQQIAGRTVTFADYVRAKTPFGFLAGAEQTSSPAVATPASSAEPTSVPVPPEGAVIGKVEIGRLNLSAVVRQGVTADTLSLAVGHVPSTAMPGQDGNFAIAAHRDTLFRVLKDIQIGDVVTFQSPTGVFEYRVAATKIVKPTDVSVLQPDGGGLIQHPPKKLLTMITCYPFYYVGSAPKRFIVEAKLLKD